MEIIHIITELIAAGLAIVVGQQLLIIRKLRAKLLESVQGEIKHLEKLCKLQVSHTSDLEKCQELMLKQKGIIDDLIAKLEKAQALNYLN